MFITAFTTIRRWHCALCSQTRWRETHLNFPFLSLLWHFKSLLRTSLTIRCSSFICLSFITLLCTELSRLLFNSALLNLLSSLSKFNIHPVAVSRCHYWKKINSSCGFLTLCFCALRRFIVLKVVFPRRHLSPKHTECLLEFFKKCVKLISWLIKHHKKDFFLIILLAFRLHILHLAQTVYHQNSLKLRNSYSCLF